MIIDFHRLMAPINNNQLNFIDYIVYIDCFPMIDFHRLDRPSVRIPIVKVLMSFWPTVKAGQHVHAQFKKDQLCLQHPKVFIDSRRKDIWRESKRTTWINHNLKNQPTNETAGPVINWTQFLNTLQESEDQLLEKLNPQKWAISWKNGWRGGKSFPFP